MTIGAGRIVGIPSSQTFPDGSTGAPLPDDRDLECDACAARWVGEPEGQCPWCVDAAERQRAEARRVLLFPPWLHDEHKGAERYDDLEEIDRRIWDHLRGTHGEGSRRAWVERLARAVTSGLVTEAEADAAIRRAAR